MGFINFTNLLAAASLFAFFASSNKFIALLIMQKECVSSTTLRGSLCKKSTLETTLDYVGKYIAIIRLSDTAS